MRANKITIIVSILLIIVLCYFLYKHYDNQSSKPEDTSTNSAQQTLEMELIAYAHAELNFIKLDVSAINSKIENETPFFLYTGRATCQWCRKMVPILDKIIQEEGITMYYLDSEDTDINKELSSFRAEYKIDTVPSIIYFLSSNEYYSFNLNILEANLEEIENNLKSEFETAYNVESSFN